MPLWPAGPAVIAVTVTATAGTSGLSAHSGRAITMALGMTTAAPSETHNEDLARSRKAGAASVRLHSQQAANNKVLSGVGVVAHPTTNSAHE